MIFFINLIACNKTNEELKEEEVVADNVNDGEDTGDKEEIVEEIKRKDLNGTAK